MKTIINGKLSHKLWFVNLWLSFIHSSDCVLLIKSFEKVPAAPKTLMVKGIKLKHISIQCFDQGSAVLLQEP